MGSKEESLGETDKQEEKKATTGAEEEGQVEEVDGAVQAGKAQEKGERCEQAEEKEEGNAGKDEEVEGGEREDKGKGQEQGEEDDDEMDEKESVKKKSKTETGEISSPRTPGTDRPTRERKMVERFTINSTPRGSATRPLEIFKGLGTQLKDIPNVIFKLSKRKADENLQLLHSILYGKKAKVHNLKKNIGLFSGFVWVENEDKQRAKVKEKLDKCVKEKLIDFCDVLDIPVNRATVKKEELSVKLLEFLESPHATTETLLSDKEKGKRRKGNESTSKSPGSSNVSAGKATKKQKMASDSGKKRKHLIGEEDMNKSEPSQSEDDQDDDNKAPRAENDPEEHDSDQELSEDHQDKPKKQKAVKKSSSTTSVKKDDNTISEKSKSGGKSSAKASKTTGKSSKDSSSSASKKGVTESESKAKLKGSSAKKQKTDKENDSSLPVKGTVSSKSSTKVSTKDKGECKNSEDKKEPSYEEMLEVVVDILKEVDFNTATLSDILRQLGKHFGVDLMHRKSEVKNIITEAIKNMSDDDEDESENESGKGQGDDA